MVGSVCLYLAAEIVLFVIIKLVLNKTVVELASPYLVFAVPGVILLPLAWQLRKWEEQGSSPKRLAFGWTLCAALFFSTVAIVVIYSGVELHLVNLNDEWSFIVAGMVGVPTASLTVYRMALVRISARANRNVAAVVPDGK